MTNDSRPTGHPELLNHKDRSHSEFGGSAAHRIMNCPGSVFLYRNCARRGDTEASLRGTKLHERREKGLKNLIAHKLEGTPLTEEHLKGLDSDEKYSVTRSIELTFNKTFEEAVTGKVIMIEQAVTLFEEFGMYGSIDTLTLARDDRGRLVMKVEDYKSGDSEVEAEENEQLLFYAVAAKKFVESKGKEIDLCICAINQPRPDDANNDELEYKPATYSVKKLEAWEKKFRKIASQIYIEKKPSFKTGDHCKWCDAKAICDKYHTESQEKSALSLVKADTVKLPLPENVPLEKVIMAALYGDKFTDYIKSCKSYIISLYNEGNPDVKKLCKVIETKGKRAWIKDEEEVAEKLKECGVDPWRNKLITIGDAEKALGKGTDLMAELTEVGKGSTMVVPLDDPRESKQTKLDMLDG